MSNIPEFSVSELSSLTKNLLEENFSLIRVKGEITNVKEKGHCYFTLKDEDFVLNAVCWSSKVPYLNFKPEEGMEVFAEGKLSTYAKGSISTYSLHVNQINVQGEGALLKLFKERQKKLQKEGLFDQDHKKNLPFLPKKIGVITSSTGAVIMDIIDRIENRFPTPIELYPASVQGINSSKEIINGIKYFNDSKSIDVLIIARGGGGPEDFIGFNEEDLVREVFACKIPIISAIGHETDFTLLDYVADVRAATPTAAAEIVVPERLTLLNTLKNVYENLDTSIKHYFKKINREFSYINKLLNTNNLKKFLTQNHKNLDNVFRVFSSSFLNDLKIKKSDLTNLGKRFLGLDIKNTLKRGFSIIRDVNNKVIKNSKNLKGKDKIKAEFFDEEIILNIKNDRG